MSTLSSPGAANGPTRILIVEDNADLAFGLQRTLETQGYVVQIAANGTQALQRARSFAPALIILDLMIPAPDGFEVLKTLRREGTTVPLLILSARSEEADKVRGLGGGADDFVTKPFGLQELLARVQALLRRSSGHAKKVGPVNDVLRIAGVELDVLARRAVRGEIVVPLSPMEFDLLVTLVRQPGRAFTRADLLRDVWGHAPDIQTRTVDLHIAEIRRKIEPVPHAPRHIVTVYKTGYRFDP